LRISVRITEVEQETSAVKCFQLDLCGHSFNFLPGQWLDCYLDKDESRGVAGYTITSPPPAKGLIELAVKLSEDNPVTKFLHQEAEIGDVLFIDGPHGSFYYKREMGDQVVLIARDIGITPMMSILRYIDGRYSEVKATLLYSAENPGQLIYKEELMEIGNKNPNIRCLFTVTGSSPEDWPVHIGEIDEEFIQRAGIDLNSIFLLCGPPPHIPKTVTTLRKLGVKESGIKYEEWW